MKKQNEWRQSYFGFLPDDSRVMIVNVSANRGRRGFFAVLICKQDGLYRLWGSGRCFLLASGYSWPLECHRERDALATLQPFLPKHWGGWHDSIKQLIPDRLLDGATKNIARLLIAWHRSAQVMDMARIKRARTSLFEHSVLPTAKPWRPMAITVIPNTDMVVRALNSGSLLHRLKRGLERIYVSEMAWVKAPIIKSSLWALALRFPDRLVIIKVICDRQTAVALKVTRERAYEYQFIGYQLQNAYEDDFGYDKYDAPRALEGMYRFRVGVTPRGVGMIFVRQRFISFEQWADLDFDGMVKLEELASARRAEQAKRSGDVVSQLLAEPRIPLNLKDPPGDLMAVGANRRPAGESDVTEATSETSQVETAKSSLN